MFDILSTLSRIGQSRILVVGDLMLDHYIKGSTERTSPEAPVPVVLYSGESRYAGGACNVARNLLAAGAKVDCIGLVGHDATGSELRSVMLEAGISDAGLVVESTHVTIRKTRIVSQGQQIVRLDREAPAGMAASAEKEMIEKIAALAAGAGAIIISDYGKGTISPAVFQAALHWGKSLNIPVFVDPKGRDYSRYHGATALTPNLREAGEAVGTDLQGAGEQQFLQAAKSIIQTTGCKWLIITRGGDGLSLFETGAEQTVRIAASSREVFDVTGAGDTFVAWLAAGTCAGLVPEEASRLANAAAGIAVSRSGVAVVSPWEVRGALIPSGLGRKLIAPDALQTLGEELHRQNKKIVFTNGCFDFLHAGHVAFLQQAREMGDVLVLGMNDDPGIGRLKGPMRPIIGQQQREVLLASIEAVDYLVPFSEDTPDVLIKALRPDLLVKGGNYEVGGVQGADIVLAYGGRVATLPIVHEVSTGRLAPILRKQS